MLWPKISRSRLFIDDFKDALNRTRPVTPESRHLFVHFRMFDTLSYACFLTLLASYGSTGLCPRGWKCSVFTHAADGPPSGGFDMKLEHPLLGIRIFAREGIIVKVEAELPKLLYGHNGRLLATQAEVDAALQRLKAILQTFSEPLGPKLGFFPRDNPCDTQTHYTGCS